MLSVESNRARDTGSLGDHSLPRATPVDRNMSPALFYNVLRLLDRCQAPELAGGGEGGHLDGDLAVAVVGIIVVPPALLLLGVSVLGVDEAHGEGALGPAGLVDLTSSLARGSHID